MKMICKIKIEKKNLKKTLIKTFDLNYFVGKRYFDDNGSQHY